MTVCLFKSVPSKTLLAAVLAACIGGTFQYGYNVSVISSPTKAVQAFINETWVERHGAEIPTQLLMFLWSSIVSVFGIGGFIGASVGGTLAMKFGRKGTLLFNNSFALLAALLMGMSYYADAFELLILGRFLSGVNAGVAICVEPLYLGEIAPRALRGAMAMGTSIFISGGILTGQVMGLRSGFILTHSRLLSHTGSAINVTLNLNLNLILIPNHCCSCL
uniref:Solute carrier family 2 member 11b n=1 Tax=Pygocentrus nattereri TaxID=42514 RepID=A0AAR2K308_PYGNA